MITRRQATLPQVTRRQVAAGLSAALLAPTIARAATRTVRVGYQKYGNLLLLKASGVLEAKLQPLGASVEWKQFVSGPPLMEALGAGAIDYGSAGETPPIFAQAAGAPIVYWGAEPPAPRGEAILVRDPSPLKTLADLRGKTVAFNKGSNVHVLFVRAIEKAGLSPRDVSPVYLNPADGRAAFERGSVDAWVIWDPFLAAAQATGRTRVLADGSGLAANHQFYLGNRRFADREILDAIAASIQEIDARTRRDSAAAAKMLATQIGLPEAVVATALTRQSWEWRPMDKALVDDQQTIADAFYKLGLLPRPIRIADALPSGTAVQ